MKITIRQWTQGIDSKPGQKPFQGENLVNSSLLIELDQSEKSKTKTSKKPSQALQILFHHDRIYQHEFKPQKLISHTKLA